MKVGHRRQAHKLNEDSRKQKLLILNLEDNLNGAALNKEMLAREGINCELICVGTREDFLEVIERESLDIILADYSMPSFDGLCALGLAREHCPDVPFIFISGTSGEEIAIEALKSGATDYVLKGNLSRLAPAVLRALKDRDERNERERFEAKLRQSARLESMGTLAGGIAHDFNNILSAIIGYTELALYKLTGESPLRQYLKQVLDASSRASDLVKQILIFSRKTGREQKPVMVSLAIREALKQLEPSLPTTIDIRLDISASAEQAVVLVDPTEMHQVLMNLCANAAHAMREKGGVLSVKLSDTMVDPFTASRHPQLQPGPYVCLTVSDTGHGMEKAVMERIFDPYFTTKGIGEGPGLGLAVVHGIVKGCGGAITVHSKPEQGATFNVFLPNKGHWTAPAETDEESLPTGNERILMVDDEIDLADLGKGIIESLGYRVTALTSSREALETFRLQPDAFDLVITDMVMPGLTGHELAKELLAIRPHMPIILYTGFSDLIDEKQAKEAGIREYIMKPYKIISMAAAISRALEAS
jgi:signal transduction histidine kinase